MRRQEEGKAGGGKAQKGMNPVGLANQSLCPAPAAVGVLRPESYGRCSRF